VLAVLLVASAVGTAPRWGPKLLSHLDFFRVRHVEVRGTRYLMPADVAARVDADTSMSIWDDLTPLRTRALGHPQIADAHVRRKLPGTVVVTIDENLPVALVAAAGGMQPYDAAARRLPIDPSRMTLDLPVLYAADSALLAALGRIAIEQPAVYQRINSARRDGSDAMILELDSFRVRAELGVSGSRLSDIFPVESDLARRGAHAAELDLRYRDQVIVRLP
jgi:cell division septal protein FtsQ